MGKARPAKTQHKNVIKTNRDVKRESISLSVKAEVVERDIGFVKTIKEAPVVINYKSDDGDEDKRWKASIEKFLKEEKD